MNKMLDCEGKNNPKHCDCLECQEERQEYKPSKKDKKFSHDNQA